MNCYHLVVAILAFSTTIDLSEAASCYNRDYPSTEGSKVACDPPKKCYAYIYMINSVNMGKCDTAGCDDFKKLWCKECTGADCNTRASIALKCYQRISGATTEGTADTACTATPPAGKCVSYYDASGNNIGKCLDSGCSDSTVSSLHCKDCLTDNCNVKSLIRKCYVRTTSTTSGDGTSTNCATTLADPKCVSYYDASGNNLGECKDGGCGSQANCQECAGDNCNVRSLDTTTTAAPTTAAPTTAAPTTAAPTTAAPTSAAGGAAPTTPRAAATRASVGWQTGIMAASACVLVLMKPF